jgi:hypothetical protein
MKVCPGCSFSNDERFPTCALCNTVIVDVPPTPSVNPDDPEHERRVLSAKRHRITRGQIRAAAALYALIITLTAIVPGLVFSPQTLLFYFASSLVVVVAMIWDIVGQFTASLLQGALSVTLIMFFGPLQPLIFFMLALHVIVPAFLWHWMEMIHSANR